MSLLYECELCGDEKPEAGMARDTLKGYHPHCQECEAQHLAEGWGEPDQPRRGESFGHWNNRVFGRAA